MSFFSALKEMANESHGNAIHTELKNKLLRLKAHEPSVVQAGLAAFRERVEGQQDELLALPRDTKISTGKFLQSQGREIWETDLINAISLYLSGAWLESSVRPGPKAAEAHQLLSAILDNVSQLQD